MGWAASLNLPKVGDGKYPRGTVASGCQRLRAVQVSPHDLGASLKQRFGSLPETVPGKNADGKFAARDECPYHPPP